MRRLGKAPGLGVWVGEFPGGWGSAAPLLGSPGAGLFGDVPLLLQTANGNVEAKVVCFYRRRDISSTLIALADKHASESRPSHGQPRLSLSPPTPSLL